jgi:hypothetical protein
VITIVLSTFILWLVVTWTFSWKFFLCIWNRYFHQVLDSLLTTSLFLKIKLTFAFIIIWKRVLAWHRIGPRCCGWGFCRRNDCWAFHDCSNYTKSSEIASIIRFLKMVRHLDWTGSITGISSNCHEKCWYFSQHNIQ